MKSKPVIFFCLFLGGAATLSLAAPATVVRGGVIKGAVVSQVFIDPCDGKAIGEAAAGGAICAGAYNGNRYMATPGQCTDSVTPTCAGGTDIVTKMWANGSGTSAYMVVTGAGSMSDGEWNTAILMTNYTDTDAARYCANMDYGGHADWFLPARDELYNVFYLNKEAIGGFGDAHRYWASTEISNDRAWYVRFSDGAQGSMYDRNLTIVFVRCARKY